MGVPRDRATLRFGFGRETPVDAIDDVAAFVSETVTRLRDGSPAWRLRGQPIAW
jgi:cysteine sulfinate desulfinase/cysteine desulfurase-like protein